ncbi:MAG TPA: hypothetical protein VOA78_07205 [Candidatus Dormibacteraeota bacterium]|nr:hypothetical protein [Candidatus Dormibacteraeota bacterium]
MRAKHSILRILCLLNFLYLFNFPDLAVAQDATYTRDLLAWLDQHTAKLTKPDGWLSLAGLEWLQPGDNSLGSAAG